MTQLNESTAHKTKVVVTGAAGLVGQNLITLLSERSDLRLIAIDKHKNNLELLARLHPSVQTVHADLAQDSGWQAAFEGGPLLIQLHAQITGNSAEPFVRNNIDATRRVLDAARAGGVPFVVHVSSSVVNSVADDDYTRTKREQEQIVRSFGLPHCVVRPTLMYGWFDPKHLGWLARLMRRLPLFPIPGHGRFMRQPLYALDFCRVIMAVMDSRPNGAVYDLVGMDRIDYVDMLRVIRNIQQLKTPFVHLPIPLFSTLLRIYGLGTKRPPFTADQLKALTAGDDFSGVDLQKTFGVRPTSFEEGMRQTLTDPRYSSVVVERYL